MIQRGSRLRSLLVGSGGVCGGGLSIVCLLLMCLLPMMLSVSPPVCVSESLVVSVLSVDSSSECFVWINSLVIGLGVVDGNGLG